MSLTLGIDCACGYTVLGLAQCDGGTLRLLFDAAFGLQRQQAALLPVLVEESLEKCGEQLKDLTALAVTTGPGAYTGVRIGASYASALAFSLGIDIYPVPTLLGMVCDLKNLKFLNKKTAPFVHARKGYVYACVVEYCRNDIIASEPAFMTLDEFCDMSNNNDALCVGDENILSVLPPKELENLSILNRPYPPGANLAMWPFLPHLGGKNFCENFENVKNLKINYVREPDIG